MGFESILKNLFVMVLVRKNVYKDVFLFLKMFSMFVKFLEMCVFVFENIKDICFESEQVTKSNLPTQKVLDVLFLLL